MEARPFIGCLKMLDDKKLKEINKRVTQFIQDRTITKDKTKEFVEFFLDNSKKSLDSAKLLYKVSTTKDLQEATGLRNFDGYLWVINSSYYSMFYLARALLENEGIKLHSDLSIHSLTFDALVHFFYTSGKLKKKLLELYEEAKQEAGELMGQQKANTLIEDYMHEKKKRGTFTYQMGLIAIKTKAKTSLDRATTFQEEFKKIIKS